MADGEIDPDDGLITLEAGNWAEKKHELLRRYLELSRGARRMFLNGPGGATYTELFAGPGKLQDKETFDFFDGSPMVACREAARTDTQFSTIYLSDARTDFVEALGARCSARGFVPRIYNKIAEEAARVIIPQLNPHGLHVVFLDPFNFDGLTLSLVKAFAHLKHVDMLIYISAMDLQRNLELYMSKQDASPLDDFAPGWRDVVRGMKPDITARGKVIEHWVSRIREAGFREAEGKPLIRGPNNQALYWLVLIAKNDLATKFWDIVSKIDQNPELF